MRAPTTGCKPRRHNNAATALRGIHCIVEKAVGEGRPGGCGAPGAGFTADGVSAPDLARVQPAV